MNNNNNKVCDCGVCLSSIDSKHIDNSVQLECGHWFHNHCIKPWCESCLDKNNQPTCPFCRQSISNEYLDILNIDYFTNSDIIKSTLNTVQLFTYIMNNKLYEDERKLKQYIARYPLEIENIMIMLEIYNH